MLWHAFVVTKVKYFLWRLVKGIIPTLDILKSRDLHVNNVCSVCGLQRESIFHVFFSCELSIHFWTLSIDWVMEEVANWSSVGQLWRPLFQRAHEEEAMDRLCTGLWIIWRNRNRSYHERYVGSPEALARWLNQMVMDYSISLEHSISASSHPMQTTNMVTDSQVWLLKSDAAFRVTSGMAKAGIVGYRPSGEVSFSAWKLFPQVRNALHACRSFGNSSGIGISKD
ncbi:hypothetical protein DITRI_Ditri03aG0103800 [Diplodiscus trichospermus]